MQNTIHGSFVCVRKHCKKKYFPSKRALFSTLLRRCFVLREGGEPLLCLTMATLSSAASVSILRGGSRQYRRTGQVTIQQWWFLHKSPFVCVCVCVCVWCLSESHIKRKKNPLDYTVRESRIISESLPESEHGVEKRYKKKKEREKRQNRVLQIWSIAFLSSRANTEHTHSTNSFLFHPGARAGGFRGEGQGA